MICFLYHSDAILQFVRNSTVHISGVGDVCSYSTFNFARHGNIKYGSPFKAEKWHRSRQGKMEKSYMSFITSYCTWEPQPDMKKMLTNLLPYVCLDQSPDAYDLFSSHQMLSREKRRGGGSSGTGSSSDRDPGQVTSKGQHVGPPTTAKTTGSGAVGLYNDRKAHKSIEMSALQMNPCSNLKERAEASLDHANFSVRPQYEHHDMRDSSTSQTSSSFGGKGSSVHWDEICGNPLAAKSPRGQRSHGPSQIFTVGNRHGALKDKLKESHGVLQQFYSDHDETVRHSMENISAQFHRGNWVDWVRPSYS